MVVRIYFSWNRCGCNLERQMKKLIAGLFFGGGGGRYMEKQMIDKNEQKTKREWVGLTEEDAKELYEYSATEWQFAQAIEAKLKELNT